jgi:uncharacterized protein
MIFFKRDVFPQLKKELTNKKILILIGSRQVGKTSLMKMLQASLINSPSLFINLDLLSLHSICDNDQSFLFYLENNGYNPQSKESFYIFVDEFQSHKNASIIFKSLYDNYTNLKIIASGSSSLQIKNTLSESMAGRTRVFLIHPLNFLEYLHFIQKDSLASLLIKNQTISDTYKQDINRHLYDFIIFGGYPEVVLTPNNEDKYKVFESIFQFYIQKDVRELAGVKNIGNFLKLLEILSLNHSNLCNVHALSHEVPMNHITLNKYLSVLEETFFISQVKPYYKNTLNALKKTKKIYFLDNGLRNYLLKNFQSLDLRTDKGALTEAYVFQELYKHQSILADIYYFRDKQGKEIDFIYSNNHQLTAIEVKSHKIPKKTTWSFVHFEKHVTLNKKIITNFSQEQKNTKGINILMHMNFIHQLENKDSSSET